MIELYALWTNDKYFTWHSVILKTETYLLLIFYIATIFGCSKFLPNEIQWNVWKQIADTNVPMEKVSWNNAANMQLFLLGVIANSFVTVSMIFVASTRYFPIASRN